MDDYKLELSDVRDEAIPQRDSSIQRVKKYTFYLGKFGPFVERIPVETADLGAELQRRVLALRQHLQMANF